MNVVLRFNLYLKTTHPGHTVTKLKKVTFNIKFQLKN